MDFVNVAKLINDIEESFCKKCEAKGYLVCERCVVHGIMDMITKDTMPLQDIIDLYGKAEAATQAIVARAQKEPEPEPDPNVKPEGEGNVFNFADLLAAKKKGQKPS